MRKLLVFISLFFATSVNASDVASDLKEVFNNSDNFSHQAMWKSGRIGELHTAAKIVTSIDIGKAGLISVVDKEIKYMDDNRELFNHAKGSIHNLYSLLRNGTYQVIYKTGCHSSYSGYSSDNIEKDLINIMKTDVRYKLEGNLKRLEYAYLKAWNTDGEYDGVEKFFLKVNNQQVVVVTIVNCGGC